MTDLEQFQPTPLTRTRKRLRLGIVGPSGSGKTYTALRMARGIKGDRAEVKAVILDTEHNSASNYADEFGGIVDHQPLSKPYSPQRYIAALEAFRQLKYGIVIIDSGSHAWAGPGGILEQVDALKGGDNSKTQNAWGKMTPVQQAFIEAILAYPGHVIMTMRTKDAYAQDPDNPRKRIKVGLAPVQRDQVDYEFDVILYLDLSHKAIVEKSRVTRVMPVGAEYSEPGEDEARALTEWLAAAPPVQANQETPSPGGVEAARVQGAPASPAPGVTPPSAPPNTTGASETIPMIDPNGEAHAMPHAAISGLIAAGWKVDTRIQFVGADPGIEVGGTTHTPPDLPPMPAPSAGAPEPVTESPPEQSESVSTSAETAEASGTPDGQGASLITPATVQLIGDKAIALTELDGERNWAADIHTYIETWYGAGSVVTGLTQEQGVEVVDRLETAIRGKQREERT